MVSNSMHNLSPLPSSSLAWDSVAKPQEGELQLDLCEQGPSGRGELLPLGGEEGVASRASQTLPEQGDEEVGGDLVGVPVEESPLAEGAASILHLDGGCLAQIFMCVGQPDSASVLLSLP